MATMSKDLLRDLNHHVLRPIANRIANSIARCVVQLVSDEKTLQSLQIGVLSGETIDHAEHYQPYGFTSVPLSGSAAGVPEGVVVFPNGDRSHPLVVVVSDRRYRPIGGEPGQVTIYNHVGTRVILRPDGTVEIRSKDGAAVPLATKADVQALTDYLRKQFDPVTGHKHTCAAPGQPTAALAEAAGPGTTGTAPSPAGTSVLKAE